MRWVRGRQAGDPGDTLQVGVHPRAPLICRASRVGDKSKPCESLVPPRPAAWAVFNATAARAIEGKIKPWLPRGSEFSCSLWQLRFPPASEGGLQGRRRQGRLFASPHFFSQARLPNLVCVWPRRCDSGPKLGCSRHSGVPSTPWAAGLVSLETGVFRGDFGWSWRAAMCLQVDSLTHGASAPLPRSRTW